MPTINDRFAKRFFIFIALIIFLIAGTLFIMGIVLNEDYFKTFSPDKVIKEETSRKIILLQNSLLIASSLGLGILLLLFVFRRGVEKHFNGHKKIIQNILVLVITLIVCIVAAEVVARIMFSGYTTGQGFGPGSLQFNAHYVSLNNDLMRDRNFTLSKPEGTTRIAILGDSFSFGQGIKNYSDTYPKVLERKLNAEAHGSYEVLNFGIPGKNTREEIAILKEKALKYNPDSVVLAYVLNDFENVDPTITEAGHRTLVPIIGFWLRNSFYSYTFLELKANIIMENIGLKKHYSDYLNEIVTSEQNREYNKQYFKELKNLSEEYNFTTIVIVFPMLNEFTHYSFYPMHDFVKVTSTEQGFYFFDMLSVYNQTNPDKLIINPYDRHPNELGHELAGEALFIIFKNSSLS